jgi:hypothetical protein
MTSPRDHVLERIFLLQQQAWSAIDDGWPGTLSGKRVAEDEKQLRSYIDDLGRFSDDIELCLSRTLSLSERRDHLYRLLFIFMSAAHFIGSRARMSFSQRNYFASKLGARGGEKSGQARAREAEDTWQAEALDLAQRERRHAPSISTERLATHIRDRWRLKIRIPAHRVLVNFLASSVKNGRLVPKVKKSARK